jgi:hypothetical protein
MPTLAHWTMVHTDLMAKLRLPCRLKFSTDVKIGQHEFDDDGCWVTINPEVDFEVPEHLILHEAAHHRIVAPYHAMFEALDNVADVANMKFSCCNEPFTDRHHCEHWAKELVKMYRETGIALPYSTGFEQFAHVAGIKFKLFEQHGRTGVLSRNMKVEVVNE